MVSGLFRHGRDRVSSPSLGNGDRRRLDPNIQRRISPKALGLVRLPSASGWSHPRSGQRAAGMAIVIHQPRARAPGARQGPGLGLPKPDRGARRAARPYRPGISNQVVQMARSLRWLAVCVGARCAPPAVGSRLERGVREAPRRAEERLGGAEPHPVPARCRREPNSAPSSSPPTHGRSAPASRGRMCRGAGSRRGRSGPRPRWRPASLV